MRNAYLLQKYLLKYTEFLELYSAWFHILSRSIKNKDTLKFLKRTNNKKPKANSTPAKPKIKKVLVAKVISSFIAPVTKV
jgi:hypothetical protein